MKLLERPAPVGVRPRLSEVRGTEPGYQAYSMLYVGYIALPLIAGLDKFAHYLVDWDKYLSPLALALIGGRITGFLSLVGLVEIAAGVLVAVKPRLGSIVVSLWLLGITANLLMMPGYRDIALRDFGLALGAFSLWRLSRQYR